MAKRDFYDILGVPKSASADEIKKAHRKLVRKFHPDVNKDNKQAEEKFKEAQEAYDVLSDTAKRAQYDQFGHAGVGGAGPPPGADPFEAFRRAQSRGGRAAGNGGGYTSGGPGGATVNEGTPDFSDVFEQMFGRGNRAKRERDRARGASGFEVPPMRGADVEHGVTISLEQAARGTELSLQVNRDGRAETINVKIPGGMKDGGRVRVRGKGQEAHGGENGDLFIVTNVAPHPYFRREELDLYVDVPLSVWEAMLGTKVDVPTLDGTLKLTIAPGTGGGAKLRLKGYGIHKGEERGDQYVVVKVTMPKSLSDEDRATIETLASRYPIVARADVKW